MKYRTRIGGLTLAAAVTAVLLAGCGDDASNATATASGGDYLSCLRDNGVNLPQMNRSGAPGDGASGRTRPSGFPSGSGRPSGSARPGGGDGSARAGGPGAGGFFGSTAPEGVDQAAWEKAQQACAALRPSGNPNGGQNNSALTAYRNCLGEHGVTASTAPEQLDANDPAIAAALQACAPLRPSARPQPSPSS